MGEALKQEGRRDDGPGTVFMKVDKVVDSEAAEFWKEQGAEDDDKIAQDHEHHEEEDKLHPPGVIAQIFVKHSGYLKKMNCKCRLIAQCLNSSFRILGTQ